MYVCMYLYIETLTPKEIKGMSAMLLNVPLRSIVHTYIAHIKSGNEAMKPPCWHFPPLLSSSISALFTSCARAFRAASCLISRLGLWKVGGQSMLPSKMLSSIIKAVLTYAKRNRRPKMRLCNALMLEKIPVNFWAV